MIIRIKQYIIALIVVIMPIVATAQKPRTIESVMKMPDSRDKLVALEEIVKTQDNIDTLVKYLDIQIDLAKQLHQNQFWVNAQILKARAYNKAYMYSKAVDNYYIAIDLCKKFADIKNQGICYNEIAQNLSRINDYNKASEFYTQALKMFIDLADTARMTDVYRNRGRQCVDFHLYETANSSFVDALTLDSAANNILALSLDYYNVAKSDYFQYLDLDSLDLLKRGITKMRHALSLALQSDTSKRIVQGCYELLMLMYVSYCADDNCKNNKFAADSAKYYLGYTEKYRSELNPNGEHIVLEITRANFLTMDGKKNEALAILKDFENMFQQSDTKYNRYKAFLYRSIIWNLKQSGNYKEAVEYSEKFKELEEATYNREFAVKSTKTAAETKYRTLIEEKTAAELKAKAEQEQKTTEQRYLTIFFAICILLATILAFIIWKGLVRKRKNNALLAQQKIEISEKNNELKIQNQKIMSQRDEIMSQRDEIESQRSQLSEANLRITASIRYAQRIQTAAVPSDDMMQKIFGEFLVYWKPLNIVSGDFFWATQAGRYKLVTAADCTGHGVPGAFMSMLGVSTLNDIAAQKDIEGRDVTAASILNELRDKIIAALRQSGSQSGSQDGMDMAFCIVDTEKMELQFTGANRPLWMVRNNELIEYKGDRMPVGYHFRKNAPFSNTVIPIKKGDVFYMGSDGLSDQFGGKEENKCKFGTKQLKDLLVAIAEKPFDIQKQIIDETMNTWRTKDDGTLESQLDDQILVGIKI